MVIPCAFYGFVNRTTKVTLEVNREQLQIGQAIDYEGGRYVILSVFESAGFYRANVGLASLHRAGPSPRPKPVPPQASVAGSESRLRHQGDAQASVLQARLGTAETTLQDLLRERDEILKRLEDAIAQLDRLHQSIDR
jgi:hypothetical protein